MTLALLLIMVFTWDPVPDAAGYLLCYGDQSGVHPNCVSVGNVIESPLELEKDRQYFLDVRAYDIDGVEGEHSEEFICCIPAPPSGMRLKSE